MKILMTIIKRILLIAGVALLAFVALVLCLLLVAAVVTKTWLLIPVVLLPVWAFFCLLDSNSH